jgi:hypothetical protein
MHRAEDSVDGDASPNLPTGSIPADFVALAGRWCANHSRILLEFVWQGYLGLLAELPAGVNKRDLERSITESLERRIRDVMSGDEPYWIQHNPYERETMLSSGQPPQYDLAFILRAEERIMWPLEAKVLKTDGAVSAYVKDVNNEFLRCRYAPFSSEGVMLGYLLSGTPGKVFSNLAAKIPCVLIAHPDFPSRPCKMSDHSRQVIPGKSYPVHFRCYHLILEFQGVVRGKRNRV